MSKFRASIIAFTLALTFFLPMTAIPKSESLPSENEFSSSENFSESENISVTEPNTPEGTFRIYDLKSETVSEVSFSDYVKGAIAAEMGADFEFEALVAQGVAAFSCGLYQQSVHFAADYDFSAAPSQKLGYITAEKAKEIYGDSFNEKWSIISSAATKALQYVVTYDGEPALTVYHAISNGTTESAENAWGNAVPYLISVESSGDILSDNYESTTVFSFDETLTLLNKNGAGLSESKPEDWFSDAEYTDAGYVDRIVIGAATFSGEKLRNIFGLRSASFSVDYKNNEFIFTVHGYGHGVGMSQVGANYMAKEGASFEEILAHYYPETELRSYS